MTPTELLESVRRVEVRTNRLVNDTLVEGEIYAPLKEAIDKALGVTKS